MKKNYIQPVMTVIAVANSQVICSSTDTGVGTTNANASSTYEVMSKERGGNDESWDDLW